MRTGTLQSSSATRFVVRASRTVQAVAMQAGEDCKRLLEQRQAASVALQPDPWTRAAKQGIWTHGG